MNFASLIFIAFAILCVLIYFLVPDRVKWIVLLIASLIFYVSWGIEKLPFVVASAWIAWAAGSKIGQNYKRSEKEVKGASAEEVKERKAKAKKDSRVVVIVAVILLLAMLAYVKVGKLIAQAYSGEISVIAPLGISYYTLSLIGYVADCYWRKEKVETNFFKLLLFTAYFPKVVQGPISKFRTLAPQLYEPHKFDYRNLCFGAQLMMWGYFKKLVIADRLAIFVKSVYGDYYHVSGSMLLVAAIFAVFQMYCDFSGCMDIACGFSEILGISLEKNFNHPFFSESASEFWRRWHITLGAWFKDYVLLPISFSHTMMTLIRRISGRFGNNVGKKMRTLIPLAIVWILTGIWHGTGLYYLVWGIYWGILTASEFLFENQFARLSKLLRINTDSKEWKLLRRIRTFLFFLIGRILTLTADLSLAGEVFGKIVKEFKPWEIFDGTLCTYGLNAPNFIAGIVFLLILLAVSTYEEKNGPVRAWIAERQLVARWTIYYGLFFVILIFGIYGQGYNASDFIYMNF